MIRRLALVALAAAALPLPARAGGRVVLVPFENAARVPSARDVVMPDVEAAIASKGHEVVTGSRVQQFLRERRIRFLDSLTTRHARELTRELQADAIVLGAILVYGGTDADPQVAITARALGREGELLWSDLVALSAKETEGGWGGGRAPDRAGLARKVVARLFEKALRSRSPGWTYGSFAKSPRVFRSYDHLGQPLVICPLPLENVSDDRLAPRLVDAVLQRQLASRPGLKVVEPAELRDALLATALPPPAQLAPDRLRQLGRTLGTPLFLRGTILAYGPGPDGALAVEIHLTLVDLDTGRIVWSGLHRRTGKDYEGFLRFGAVLDPASLADRVITELLDAFTRPCFTLEEGCGKHSRECCS
jgi:hypothetical protein